MHIPISVLFRALNNSTEYYYYSSTSRCSAACLVYGYVNYMAMYIYIPVRIELAGLQIRKSNCSRKIIRKKCEAAQDKLAKVARH